jgi:4-amino-4-deoxy-L-arabinose transferase-like glycosyltransferase
MPIRPGSNSSTRILLQALLFLAALLASLGEAYFIRQPGVMDACYYYGGGLNLVDGQGWNESFLWNYLDETAVLPHPGNMYWMPLPSLLAAAGMFLAGAGFRQAQILLIVLATVFPFLVFWTGKRLTGSFRLSILAGFFSIASGFFTVYWLNTESFLAYACLGGSILFLLPRPLAGYRWPRALLIGVLCGLAHLTRADGILFLALAGFLLLAGSSEKAVDRVLRLMVLGAGYLITTGIWYARNLSIWGSPFPPGAEKAAWLTEYNDLFLFPSSAVSMERFLKSGLASILTARWDAFQTNLITTVFVLGFVFMVPLIGWGIYLLRRQAAIRTALLYFLLIFLLMTIVYPFQGSRGGFLHSASALLCIVSIAASVGLDDIISRLSRWRNWQPESSRNVLGAGFAGLALFASGAIYINRVIGPDPGNPAWSRLNGEYERGISQLGPELPESTRFMVNNPPCFHIQTGFTAVPVTAGDPAMLLEAADRYDVHYVILDSNVPDGLQALYLDQSANPRLKKIFSDEYEGMLYIWYEVLPPDPEGGP